jgi:hypothetical protein
MREKNGKVNKKVLAESIAESANIRERIGLPGIPEDLKKGMKAFLYFEELSTKIEIEDENVTTGW